MLKIAIGRIEDTTIVDAAFPIEETAADAYLNSLDKMIKVLRSKVTDFILRELSSAKVGFVIVITPFLCYTLEFGETITFICWSVNEESSKVKSVFPIILKSSNVSLIVLSSGVNVKYSS